MAKQYTGIPEPLRREVLERDRHRCRWCGRTDEGLDLHHIEYRRGYAYDVAENLISLCRMHHGLVHGIKYASYRFTLTKAEAQEILHQLVATPGLTGSALHRQREREKRS